MDRTTLIPRLAEFRTLLLKYIEEDEYSDLPIKLYRVYTIYEPTLVAHLTIESKTKLGAIIAYADWRLLNLNDASNWEYYEQQCTELYPEYLDNLQKLEEFVAYIVKSNIIDQGDYRCLGEDELLVEITREEKISPFNQSLIKKAT